MVVRAARILAGQCSRRVIRGSRQYHAITVALPLVRDPPLHASTGSRGLILSADYELAMLGLAAASLTDWLDGYIARQWDQKSVLGGFLDPLADKVMVTTVAMALGHQALIPISLVVVIVGRDALLVVGSLLHRAKTKLEGDGFFAVETVEYRVNPTTLSKVNTGLQFLTLWMGLTNAVCHVPGDAGLAGLCLLTGSATVASGVNYFLVSGLQPRGRLGMQLMARRERMKEHLKERGDAVKERIDRRRASVRAAGDKVKGRVKDIVETQHQRAKRTSEENRLKIGGGKELS